MNIDKQIIMFLIIIILFLLLLNLIVIRKFKRINKVSTGLDIGEKMPFIDFENIMGKNEVINETFFNQERVFLFLDANCSECKKVFNTLNYVDEQLLTRINIVLLKSDENINKMTEHKLRNLSIFVEPHVISEKFKLNSYPFFLKIDSSGNVIDKGYVVNGNILEHLA